MYVVLNWFGLDIRLHMNYMFLLNSVCGVHDVMMISICVC